MNEEQIRFLIGMGGIAIGALLLFSALALAAGRFAWRLFGSDSSEMLAQWWKNRLSVKLQVAPPLPPLDPALILRPEPVRPEDRPS